MREGIRIIVIAIKTTILTLKHMQILIVLKTMSLKMILVRSSRNRSLTKLLTKTKILRTSCVKVTWTKFRHQNLLCRVIQEMIVTKIIQCCKKRLIDLV